MMSSKGFSTIVVLIVVTISGLFVSLWSSMREQQLRGLKFLERKIVSNNISRQMSDLFQDTTLCDCQITGAGFTLDATQTGGQVVTVASLRTGCAAGDPVLVANGTAMPGGMSVARIELADLKPSAPGSLLWDGFWRVHWNSGDGIQLRPAEIPQRVQLDATTYAATPTSTQISLCLPTPVSGGGGGGGGGVGSSIINSCAPGWQIIGPPGAVGTFCIEIDDRNETTYHAALLGCPNPSPTSQGNPKLCNHTKWILGCQSGLLTDATDGPEWNVEYAGSTSRAVGSGNGSCTAMEKVSVSNSIKYRCCYP